MDLDRPVLHTEGGGHSSDDHHRARGPHDDVRQRFADGCDIRLALPASAQNVAPVRHVVGGVAERMGFEALVVHDVCLAVTEACTNVVRHAYRGGPQGLIDIVITAGRDTLTIVVADRGRGMVPEPSDQGPGLGLPLMTALADGVEIDHSPAGGTRVSMKFGARRQRAAREAA